MAKRGYKKVDSTFLIELSLPEELIKLMDKKDRARLNDLNRLDLRWKAGSKRVFIFYLSELNKVRLLLQRYGYTVAYPNKAELRRYGLTYSGDSLEIHLDGDTFEILQSFPDGRIERHRIPKDRVFTVYYTIKRFFEKHPELEKVSTSVLWEEFCKVFNIRRFFDRKGTFHSNSFFGDRRTYYDFAYLPLKVLQHIGKIEYRGKYVYNTFRGDMHEEV